MRWKRRRYGHEPVQTHRRVPSVREPDSRDNHPRFTSEALRSAAFGQSPELARLRREIEEDMQTEAYWRSVWGTDG